MKSVFWLLLSLFITQSIVARDFVVGVENLEYSPIYTTNNGNYEGYARDLLDAFGKAAGYTFHYRPLPVKRLFADFFAGKFDFKYPDNPQWVASERDDKTLYYSAVTLVAIDGVMVPAMREPGKPLTKLVTLRGFTPRVYMDAISQGSIVMQEVNDLNAALSSVLVGRAEGVYSNIVVAAKRLEENGQAEALVFDRELPYADAAFSLSTMAHPQVIDEFNTFLLDHADLVAGLKKYYGVDID